MPTGASTSTPTPGQSGVNFAFNGGAMCKFAFELGKYGDPALTNEVWGKSLEDMDGIAASLTIPKPSPAILRSYELGVQGQADALQAEVDKCAQFDRSMKAVKFGARCREADIAACDAYQERGFVTKREDPRTEVGYCHGLGHGVGIEIHERPSINWLESNTDVFEAGQVFTIEPGLYFPEEEIGCRIEDTVHLAADGTLDSLATLPHDAEALTALAKNG